MAAQPAIDTHNTNLEKDSSYILFRIFSIKTDWKWLVIVIMQMIYKKENTLNYLKNASERSTRRLFHVGILKTFVNSECVDSYHLQIWQQAD